MTYTDEGIKIASRSALANVFTKLFGSGDDITRLTHLTGHARASALKQIQRELNQLDDAARAARLAQLPLVERFLIDGNFAHNFYSILVRLRHNPRDTEALEILGKLGFDKKTLPELQAAIRRHSSGIYSDKEFLDALRYDKGLKSQGVPFDVWSGVDNARLYDEFGRMFKPGASELMSRPPVKFSFDGYSGPKKVYIFEDAPDIVWAPRQLTDHFFKTDQDLSHMIMQDPVILGPGRSKDLLGEMLNNYYGAHTVSPEGLAALEAQGAVVRLKGSPPKQYSGFRDLELEAGRPSPTGQAPDPAQKYEYFDLDGPEFTPVEAAAPPTHLPADTPPPPEGAGVSILPRKPRTDPAIEAEVMEKAYWRVLSTQGPEAADAWAAHNGFKLSRERVDALLKANEKAGANTETLDNIVNGLERRGLLPDRYGEIKGDYWIAPGLRAPSKAPAEPARVPLFPWLENFELFPVSMRGVVDSGASAMRDASHAGWNGIYSLLQKNRPWVMRELGGSPMPRNVIYRDGKPHAPTTTGSYILHTDDGIQLVSPFKPGSPVPSAWDFRGVEIPEHSWLSGWGEPGWQVPAWFSGRGNLVWPAPEGSAAGQLVYGPLGRIGRVTAEGTVESFSPVSASIPKEVVNGDIVQFNNGAVAQYVVPETGPPYLQPAVGQAKWTQNPEGAFTATGSNTAVPADKPTIVYNSQASDDPLWNFFTYKIFSGKGGKPYAPMTEDQAVRLQQADVDLSRAADTPYTLEVTPPSVLRRWFDPRVRVSVSGDEELGTALTRNHGKAYGPQQSGLPEERLGPYGPSISPPSRPIIVPHPQSPSPSPRVWSLPRQVFPPVYEGLRWLGVPGRSLTIRPVDKILWSVLPKSWQKYRPSQIAKTRLNAQASAFQKGVAAAVNTGATGLTLGALYAAADPMGRMYGHGQMAIQDPGKSKEHVQDALVAGTDTVAAVFGLSPETASAHRPTYAEQSVRSSTSSNTPHDTDPSSTQADPTTAASTPTVDLAANNPNISAQTPSSWVVPGALLGGLVGGAFGGLTARGETEEERRRNRTKGFVLGGVGGTILGGLGGYAADQYQA